MNEKNTTFTEESLFDDVNLKPLSEFIANFGIDALRNALNESISQAILGDSDD